MAFSPQPPFPKSRGDSVRSVDWNETVKELVRLERDKADRSGDTFKGPLTVTGQLTATKGLNVGPANAPRLRLQDDGFLVFGSGSQLSPDQGGSIELGVGNAPGSGTPYIDFHYQGLSQDYNVRLINNGNRVLSVEPGSRGPVTLAVSGDLLVSGKLRGGIGAGQTAPGAGWSNYGATGATIIIDTSRAGFSTTPVYVCAIGGGAQHWATTGGSAVYSPTPTSFQVYVRWSDGRAMSAQDAVNGGWFIHWIGVVA